MDYRESVALVIKFMKGSYFCVYDFYRLKEKRVLRTCGGILGIYYYEPENICHKQSHHKWNNELLAQQL